jgi:hypothetical protein
MASLHLTLFIVTISAGNLDLNVPLYRTALRFEETISSEGRAFKLTPFFVEDGGLPFTILTALFFLITFIFHLLNATILFDFYISELKDCRSPTRWLEYFLSAPVMIIIVAYTLGARDRSFILALAALTAVTMPFGYLIELLARPRNDEEWVTSLSQRLIPFFFGWIPQIAVWGLIVLNFYGENYNTEKIPWFVYLILWTECLLFLSFGVASLLGQIRPPKEFWRSEKVFQILSLVSKASLGVLLISNVLILSRFDEIFE